MLSFLHCQHARQNRRDKKERCLHQNMLLIWTFVWMIKVANQRSQTLYGTPVVTWRSHPELVAWTIPVIVVLRIKQQQIRQCHAKQGCVAVGVSINLCNRTHCVTVSWVVCWTRRLRSCSPFIVYIFTQKCKYKQNLFGRSAPWRRLGASRPNLQFVSPGVFKKNYMIFQISLKC